MCVHLWREVKLATVYGTSDTMLGTSPKGSHSIVTLSYEVATVIISIFGEEK